MNDERVFRLKGIWVTFFLVFSLFWLPNEADAQESFKTIPANAQRYEGTYKYSKNFDHGRKVIRHAMEKIIEEIPFLFRGRVRRKMQSSDPLIHNIVIGFPAGKISVTLNGEKSATMATQPGTAEKVKNHKGKLIKLTQRFRKGSLEQVFVGEKGSGRTLYTLLDDNRRLVFHTKMKFSKVKTHFTYRLVYVRQ